MPRKKKVQDNPDLVKDTTSQAVINTNTSALLNRKMQNLHRLKMILKNYKL